MKRWTKEEDSMILSMLSVGKTRAEICRSIGVSRHAVSGRIYRISDERKCRWVPMSNENPRRELLLRIEHSGIPLEVMTEESGVRIREHNPSWRRGTQKMRDSTAWAIERYLDGIERKAD